MDSIIEISYYLNKRQTLSNTSQMTFLQRAAMLALQALY